MAESGLEGYGEEVAVVEASFGIAGGEKKVDRSLCGYKRCDTYTFAHQSMEVSRNRLQGARDSAKRKQKVQKAHPREFGERGNEILGTRLGAQPRARKLVEGACYLVSACRDLHHPSLQD